MRTASIIVGVIAGFWVVACRVGTGPLPRDAQPMRAPAVYQRWWAMTEACSGHSGNLNAVKWYSVPGAYLQYDGQTVSGYWSPVGNQIVLAQDYTRAGFLVRHEMLHALLRQDGHPRDQFLGACAAFVTCEDRCVEDAGSWNPPMDFVPEPADSVDVTAETELMPVDGDGDRWLSMWVSVRNPNSKAIYVQAPAGSTIPPGFGFDVSGPKGGVMFTEVTSDSSRFFFAPLETKQFLFEFVVADTLTQFTLPAGDYVIRGAYARNFSADQFITVTP